MESPNEQVLKLKSGLEARVETFPKDVPLPDQTVLVLPGTLADGKQVLRRIYATTLFRTSSKGYLFGDMNIDVIYRNIRDAPYCSLEQFESAVQMYRSMYGCLTKTNFGRNVGIELARPISVTSLKGTERMRFSDTVFDFFNAYLEEFIRQHPEIVDEHQKYVSSHANAERAAGRLNGQDATYLFMFNDEPELLEEYAASTGMGEATYKLIFQE